MSTLNSLPHTLAEHLPGLYEAVNAEMNKRHWFNLAPLVKNQKPSLPLEKWDHIPVTQADI